MGTLHSTHVAAGHGYCASTLSNRGRKHAHARVSSHTRAGHSRPSLQRAATGFTAQTYPPCTLSHPPEHRGCTCSDTSGAMLLASAVVCLAGGALQSGRCNPAQLRWPVHIRVLCFMWREQAVALKATGHTLVREGSALWQCSCWMLWAGGCGGWHAQGGHLQVCSLHALQRCCQGSQQICMSQHV
jgi:hypothetical protein